MYELTDTAKEIIRCLKKYGKMTLKEMSEHTSFKVAAGHITHLVKKGIVEVVGEEEVQLYKKEADGTFVKVLHGLSYPIYDLR